MICQTKRPFIASAKRCAFKMSYSPYLDRAQLRKSSAVEQMAQDFLMFRASAGSINQDDLEILGWTPSQIALHTTDARRMANRLADARRTPVCEGAQS